MAQLDENGDGVHIKEGRESLECHVFHMILVAIAWEKPESSIFVHCQTPMALLVKTSHGSYEYFCLFQIRYFTRNDFIVIIWSSTIYILQFAKH